MNKTVSINLGGQVFQIDELAYERLWKYLESIKAKYANTKGGSDIIADIESRLAEMFFEYLGFNRKVVTMEDVELTIGTMGHPDDFEIPLEDDEEIPGGSKKTTGTSGSGSNTQRRLFRNEDDKIIGGVASGLSAYFGITDPIWIRLLFLFTFFFGIGSSFLVYLVLLVLVPKASTASEKLQMRGEPINIDNIEKTIREELSDLENRINNSRKGERARGVLARLVDFVATILGLFFKVLGKLIGLLFVVLSILFMISLLLGISIPSMVEDGIAFNMLPHLFDSTSTFAAAIIGFGLLFFIPCLYMLYAGIAILLNKRINLKGTGLMASGLMIVGIVLVIYSISNVNSHSDATRKRVETQVLAMPIDGILRLKVANDERSEDNFKTFGDWGKFREEQDTLYVRQIDGADDADEHQIIINVKKAPGNDFIIEKTYIAAGQDRDMAYYRTENITYNVSQDSANLYLPLYYAYPAADKIRGQKVRVDVLVPLGQSVYLSHNIRELIYDIKNVTNMYDGKMVGHTWKMMPAGLTCLDCGDDVQDGLTANTGTSPAPPNNGYKMEMPEFNQMKISGAIKFHVVYANTSQVIFRDADMLKHTTVNTDGKKLTLEQDEKFGLFNNEIVEVWIYTPSIDNIIALGASEGDINGFKTNKLYIELAGASDCTMNIEADKLTVHLSGASNMVLTGLANQLKAELNGASNLEAFNFTSTKVDVHASGASNAEVFALTNLKAQAVGASNIDYRGEPIVSSNSSGFSSINAKP